MRRADRLFRLVQTLRDGRLTTAARLAQAMEVSERTVYRDIADLQASGVPIDGAAGVGYMMRDGYDLPPLMFDQAEITALALGARLVAAWGGDEMATGARDALSKIEAALPENASARSPLGRLDAFGMTLDAGSRGKLDELDAAARDRRFAKLDYEAEDGTRSTRTVRPLALWFWGPRWTLVAWCELRDDFRMFRVDRIVSMAISGETFVPAEHRSIAAFRRRTEDGKESPLPPDPFD